MKKVKISGKLSFDKHIVSNLELTDVIGGATGKTACLPNLCWYSKVYTACCPTSAICGPGSYC